MKRSAIIKGISIYIAGLLILLLLASNKSKNDTIDDDRHIITEPRYNDSSNNQFCEVVNTNNTFNVIEGITLRLDQTKYPPGTQEFTLSIENNTEVVFTYGISWYFQKYNDGDWELVEENVYVNFPAILYDLECFDTYIFTVKTSAQLEPGLYRLRIQLTFDESTNYFGMPAIPKVFLEFIICECVASG